MFQFISAVGAPLPLPVGSRDWRACADVIQLIAREKHISVRLLINRSRCRANAARARQLAMYLSHVVLGVSLTDVGRAFGRDRTTVAYACAVIEDMRDDRAFDDDVTALERLIESQQDGEPGHDH